MVIIGNAARMCLPCRRRTSSTRSSGSLKALVYPISKSLTMASISIKRRKAVRYRNRSSIPYRYR